MSQDDSNSEKSSPKGHLREVGYVSLIIVLTGFVLYWLKAPSLTFNPFEASEFFAMITSMFVVAILMERSVAAILIPIRAPHSQELEQELEELKEEQKQSPSENLRLDEKKKEKEIADYRLGTAQRAYWMSFIFGLCISVVGIRTLATLIDQDSLRVSSEAAQTLFAFVDVILTGGVIAGGSAAIAKIGRSISTTFNLNRPSDHGSGTP